MSRYPTTTAQRRRENAALLKQDKRRCKYCKLVRPLKQFCSSTDKQGRLYYHSGCRDCENNRRRPAVPFHIRMTDPDGVQHRFVNLLPSDVQYLVRNGWVLGSASA